MKAHYRKLNDRTLNSSTYHKKDGTNIRAKLKEELRRDVARLHRQLKRIEACENIETARTIARIARGE